MRILIKNMKCPAHIYFVKQELDRLGINYKSIIMGEVDLQNDLSIPTLRKLNVALLQYGFTMEYDDRTKIVLKIKTAINDYIDNSEIEMKMSLHQFIAQEVNHSFYFVNFIFLEETGITVDLYHASKKIERAIELLDHYNLTLTEVAYQLNYSSDEEFINQFKSITGLRLDRFKKFRRKTREFNRKVTV